MPDFGSELIDPEWLQIARSGKTRMNNPDGSFSTIKSVGFEADGRYYIAPTIRLIDGQPVQLSRDEAIQMAMERGDAIPFDTQESGDAFARALSKQQGKDLGR